MCRRLYGQARKGWGAMLLLVVAGAAWILFLGEAKQPEWRAASQAALRRPTGSPQLVSIEPLPMMDGEMCQWVPASTSTNLATTLQQSSAGRGAEPPKDARVAVDVDRPPARVIKDAYPTFSAIAVEPESNMLVVTDENLFQILEYDRRDNTPPQAKMSEPKRIIAGTRTKAEMMCGVYIDPKTLDTYVVNNDTQNWMAVFSKDAQGNVEPDRFLAVPHGAFGIAADEERQELFITIQHNNAVVVYRKMASGEEEPLREIFGDDTGLEDPHGLAVDSKNNLLFVSNHGNGRYRERGGGELEAGHRENPNPDRSTRQFLLGSGYFDPPSITVYRRDAKGNVAPLRTIEGHKTRLNWPVHMAVDEERGELYVANDMDNSILVFRVNDHGDVAPTRMIRGPKTGLKNPAGISLDLKNQEVWAANMGNRSATVYPMLANGDVAPLRTIRGGPSDEPSLLIVNPGGVGYDTKREELLVPN